jgi:penicillin amidase
MDLLRRFAAGRVTELIGEFPLVGALLERFYIADVDLYFRAVFMARDGRPIVAHAAEKLNEATRTALEAYAAGVNAFLRDVQTSRNGASKPPAYEGLVNPDAALLAEWTVEDSLGVMLVDQWARANSIDLELLWGEALAAWGADKLRQFIAAPPAEAVSVLPASANGDDDETAPDRYAGLAAIFAPAQKALSEARDAGLSAASGFTHQNRAANLLAVDGARSADGRALLAADLAFRPLSPPPYHLIHLDSETAGDGALAVEGLGLPGAPGVLLGHNQSVGWIAGGASYDVADVYLEKLTESEDAVWFDGDRVAIRTIPQAFRLGMSADAETVEKDVQVVSPHGPVIPGSCQKGYCVSLRWTGEDAGNDLAALLALQTANDLDGALAAVAGARAGSAQWMLAGVDGRIAYSSPTSVPQRANWRESPPFLPLAGFLGESEWAGAVPAGDMAQVLAPESGLLVAGDNDIYGVLAAGQPTAASVYYYGSADLGLRAARLTELLSDGDALTLDRLAAVLADTTTALAPRLLEYLQDAAAGRPDLMDATLQTALTAMLQWDATLPAAVPDRWRGDVADEQQTAAAHGAAVFEVWFHHVLRRTFADDFAEAKLDLPADVFFRGPENETRMLLALLDGEDDPFAPVNWWDDLSTAVIETREETLLTALRDAVDELTVLLGPEPSDWLWGKLHTAEFGLDLEGADLLDFIAPTIEPARTDGGDFTVQLADPAGLSDYTVGRSSSARLLMAIDGNRFEARAALAGGQSERFDSPHFADQFGRWINQETIPLPFALGDVVDAAVQRVLFTPRP